MWAASWLESFDHRLVTTRWPDELRTAAQSRRRLDEQPAAGIRSAESGRSGHDRHARLLSAPRPSIPEEDVWRTDTGAHHARAETPNGAALEFDSSELAKEYLGGEPKNWQSGSKCIVGVLLPSREAVDELFALLTAAGHVGLRAPYDAYWGAGTRLSKILNRNTVGLMSPEDPTRKSPPPAI